MSAPPPPASESPKYKLLKHVVDHEGPDVAFPTFTIMLQDEYERWLVTPIDFIELCNSAAWEELECGAFGRREELLGIDKDWRRGWQYVDAGAVEVFDITEGFKCAFLKKGLCVHMCDIFDNTAGVEQGEEEVFGTLVATLHFPWAASSAPSECPRHIPNQIDIHFHVANGNKQDALSPLKDCTKWKIREVPIQEQHHHGLGAPMTTVFAGVPTVGRQRMSVMESNEPEEGWPVVLDLREQARTMRFDLTAKMNKRINLFRGTPGEAQEFLNTIVSVHVNTPSRAITLFPQLEEPEE